jgi:sialate O-acetylesterase
MKILDGLCAGQVLQRLGKRAGARATITGETAHDGSVTVTLHAAVGPLAGWHKRAAGRARGGKFQIALAGIPVGGPYRLTLECGNEKASVSSVFVGDVWLLAGQSNMQGIGNLDGAAKPHPLARVFTMRREWRIAKDPLHVPAESPDICHNGGAQCSRAVSESVRRGIKGAGVGLFFAREMIGREGVPQGLICAAHGGTTMGQWDPSLAENGPASLYASMLASVAATGQPVAGVLWYQGESDAAEAAAPHYTRRMQALVRAVRRDLRQPGLPWVVVQIARKFGDPGDGGRWFNGSWWNGIQDQQRLLPARIKRLETVAAVDLPLDDRIHIGADGFPKLGARMAAAMRIIRDGGMPPPQLRGISLCKENVPGTLAVDVEFRNVEGSLVSVGEPSGFAAIDESDQGRPLIFRTTLHGNKARLHMMADTAVGTLRFGYGVGFHPACNISDARGFSLPAFLPVRVGQSRAWLPFVTRWAETGVMPAEKPLRSLTVCDLRRARHDLRTTGPGPDGFVNENQRWQGCSGQVFFASVISLPEPMRLEFLTGYDGPFALWVGNRRLFLDETGTNPAVPDSHKKSVLLVAGRHEIRVAMDINSGAAWGFFLRFRRLDLSKKQIASRDYPHPDYLLPRCPM